MRRMREVLRLRAELGPNLSAGAQSAESLSEASYFVVHMLGALDCVSPVEAAGGKPIGEPIPHLERQGASGGDARWESWV